MDGMIIGMMKRKTAKYKQIVTKLLEQQELTDDEKDFLRKENLTAKRV